MNLRRSADATGSGVVAIALRKEALMVRRLCSLIALTLVVALAPIPMSEMLLKLQGCEAGPYLDPDGFS